MSMPHPSPHRPPLASTCLDLLDRARGSLLLACRTGDVGERYVEAHLGALRAAAAVLAARSMPGSSGAPTASGAAIRANGSNGSNGSAGWAEVNRPVRSTASTRGASRSRPRSVWELLPRVAPELTEWAAFFAASGRRRAAVERGGQIAARESDDLLRQSEIFLEIVQDLLGMPRVEALPVSVASPLRFSRSSAAAGRG